MGDVHMDARKKYDLLMNIAMALGFGGFILIVALIVPAWGAADVKTLLTILVWAVAVSLLLFWRYRVGKQDEGVKADVKKEAEAFARKNEEKHKGKVGSLRTGMYGEELWYLKDETVEEAQKDEENKLS